MILRLLPQNIADNWDTIKMAIKRALPPVASESPDKMNRILENLLSGVLVCWAQVGMDGTIYGVGVTQVLEDYATDTKNLLIYALYNFSIMPDEQWAENLDLLQQYAQSQGCASVIAYTEDPKLIGLAKHFGGDTKNTFISIPVKPL